MTTVAASPSPHSCCSGSAAGQILLAGETPTPCRALSEYLDWLRSNRHRLQLHWTLVVWFDDNARSILHQPVTKHDLRELNRIASQAHLLDHPGMNCRVHLAIH